MNMRNSLIDKSIVTSVSMPLSMYSQLMEKARESNISLSEVVRRALYRDLEITDAQQENGEKAE